MTAIADLVQPRLGHMLQQASEKLGDLQRLALLLLFTFAWHLHGGNGGGERRAHFLACARHLSFGYVDHPPLVPWIARLAEELRGATLSSLRLLPAVAGALTTVLAALLASYLVVLAIGRRNPRLWLVVGLVAGLGLLNKHTMLLWGAGLVVGLVLTPQRRIFRSPWLWAGGAIALTVFLPNLFWQMEHEWATLEFLRTLRQGILADIPRPLFLLGLLLYQNPVSLPLWIGGIERHEALLNLAVVKDRCLWHVAACQKKLRAA